MSRRNSPQMKSLKIFRNGKCREGPYEFPYKADLSHARTFDQVLDMLGAAMAMSANIRRSEISIRGGLPFDVAKVFTTEGKQILSLSELDCCSEIVVCGREEAYQAPSSSTSSTEISHHKRNPGGCKSSKLRRVNREDTVSKSKSVFFELPSPIGGENNNNHSTVRKTVAEMDISRFELASNSNTESMSPNKACSSHSQSLKPTPNSACESRIPKGITSGTKASIRGTSPKVLPVLNSETPSPAKAVRNHNMNIQNSKVRTSKSERPVTPSQQEFIRPKLVTVLRHGLKPRKVVRLLLNKKTAQSYDRVLMDITDSTKPDWGAVRRVYTLNGNEVATLEDFFGTEDIFLACTNGRVTPEDFKLDAEECKAIQPLVKAKFAHSQERTPRGSLHVKSLQRRSVKGGAISSPSTPRDTDPNALSISRFPSSLLDKYSIGPIIGNGNFAVVRKCIDRKSKRRFALKIIDKSKVSGQDVPSPDNEIATLTNISHPNIIILFERYDFAEELYLVMELVEGGDLFEAIAEVNNFSEADSKAMTKDVALALQYLHDRNIVHRDVKPENLLIHYQDDGQRRIKLGDFGLAQTVTGPMFSVCGTPTYVAPEILAETGYGLEVDIWALGIIVYALLCGYPPFYSPTSNQQDLFDLILAGRLEFHRDAWDGISMEAKDIITRMIDINPETRFTAEEVLQHCWLSTINEGPGEKQE